MRKPKSTDEVAPQLEHDAADEKLWMQEPVHIEARPTRTSVLSLRLPTDEFHALLRAARSTGESVSEYVRKAIAMRQSAQSTTSPTINITFTYPEMPKDKELTSDWTTYTSGNAQPKPRVETISQVSGC